VVDDSDAAAAGRLRDDISVNFHHAYRAHEFQMLVWLKRFFLTRREHFTASWNMTRVIPVKMTTGHIVFKYPNSGCRYRIVVGEVTNHKIPFTQIMVHNNKSEVCHFSWPQSSSHHKYSCSPLYSQITFKFRTKNMVYITFTKMSPSFFFWFMKVYFFKCNHQLDNYTMCNRQST